MTVVVGERYREPAGSDARAAAANRECWEARVQRMRSTSTTEFQPEWHPEPAEDTIVAETMIEEPVRPGLLKLYAARMAHAKTGPRETPAATGERLLVGSHDDGTGAQRTLALVRTTTRLGRGVDEHYQRLHPPLAMRYGRLRTGGTGKRGHSLRGHNASGQAGWDMVLNGFRTLVAGFGRQPRLAGSKRVALASCVAVLLIASVASSSLAFSGQYRYEVRSGDTIESVAATFGVNPDSIRAASYLPNGDSLEAGQVIIIPDPDQGPTEAAQDAASREGTSPWAYTAHVVEWGENPASIAADYGVDLDAFLTINGIEDPLDLVTGSTVIIPDTGSVTDSGSSASLGDWVVKIEGVPSYKQQRNLSCEYAATHAAAMTFGWAPSEQDFMDAIPNTLNPHYGYRGNIDGWWGNTEDYGIYAEPLVPVLNDWGFHGEVMYTFGDTGPLTAHIDAGHPVVTWLGFWGDTRERLTDDGNYSVFAGMHVVTVYAYDEEGVWVMDPAKGEKVHYSWDFFVQMWTVVDGMALAVYPA